MALGLLGQKDPSSPISLFMQIIDWNLAEETLSVWTAVSCRHPWIFRFGDESVKER